jgi:hypothetical protein
MLTLWYFFLPSNFTRHHDGLFPQWDSFREPLEESNCQPSEYHNLRCAEQFITKKAALEKVCYGKLVYN